MARRGLVAALLLSAAALAAQAAGAAELVMFETPGCPWCARWHRDVGGLYSKTDEGRILPLRQVMMNAVPADLKTVRNIRYAPTFVVMDCGREQGRILGYQGDEMFWGELSIILKKMKAEGRPRERC